ncbi:MAG: hypothetical protein NUV96_02740 [Candidatus Colwellbacteria bacterium]|nr:hypothetical protein [Candidatus Colwellbacteria bacterium]
MRTIEYEKTYLAKEIPEGLSSCKFVEIADIYIPKSASHPHLRIRKFGDRYEITKKEPVKGDDSSEQLENTILLTKEEFEDMAVIEGQRFRKLRYYYEYKDRSLEVDVFKDDLEGLVIVDVEFSNREEMGNFEMPSFCLADVTQEVVIAGGKLAGQMFENISEDLNTRFGYKKLSM